MIIAIPRGTVVLVTLVNGVLIIPGGRMSLHVPRLVI